jgi:nuclear pore complex protein Nup210
VAKAARRIGRERHKGLNSLIILEAWWLWKHRNDCVLNNITPSVTSVLHEVYDEVQIWIMEGA